MAHSHSHDHLLAEANRNTFDKIASSGGDEFNEWVPAAITVGKAISKLYPFDAAITSVLDYACGIGLNSREIAVYGAKEITGIDISQGMVDVYNRNALDNEWMKGVPMRAFRLDTKETEAELKNLQVDVAICVMAYHHFTSINESTKTIARLLKPGGKVIVVDRVPFTSESSSPMNPEMAHTISHHNGISEQAMQDAFNYAGLVNHTYGVACDVKYREMGMTLFASTATKPLQE